jgi:hypothetical protein
MEHPGVEDQSSSSTEKEKMVAVLRTLDLKTDPPELWQHFAVLVEAQRIYERRFLKYRDEPIQAMGWRGVLVQMRTCMERLWGLWGHNGHVGTDDSDAHDLINYAAHFIKQVRLGNRDGKWW